MNAMEKYSKEEVMEIIGILLDIREELGITYDDFLNKTDKLRKYRAINMACDALGNIDTYD